MPDPLSEDFAALRRRARLRLLRMHYEAGVGHLGGNLSALDALLFLHHRTMGADDTFILAKGHAAGALYVALWTIGELDDAALGEFHGDGTLLAGHPAPNWTPGIPLATGSLGHGLPVACGIALARRLEARPGHVFCLTSDGEWQEGSNWEALVFANHHALAGLTILVDANGLQGFGTTEEVASQSTADLARRFDAFGIATCEIDGHDERALAAVLGEAGTQEAARGPRAVLLRTVKGRGVSFMEDRFEWHYLPLDSALYEQARGEIEAS